MAAKVFVIAPLTRPAPGIIRSPRQLPKVLCHVEPARPRLLRPSDHLCEYLPGEFVCLDWRQFQDSGRDPIEWVAAERKRLFRRPGRIEPCIIAVGSSSTNAESQRREAHQAATVGVIYYSRPEGGVAMDRIAERIAMELGDIAVDLRSSERPPRDVVSSPTEIKMYANPAIRFSDDDVKRLFAQRIGDDYHPKGEDE